MSTFSVKTTSYLRSLYSADRSLAYKTSRETKSAMSLQSADQTALRKGIRSLADWDYEGTDDDDEVTLGRFYSHLKAFTDAYNYTLDSGKAASSNDYVRRAIKNIKTLTAKNEDALKDLCISLSSDGSMTVSDSAVDNIDNSNFEKVFGKDSEYMKGLRQYSQALSHRIDAYA